MRCEHCGTENNFEWATFCRNCQQPLRPKGEAIAANKAQLDSTVRLDNHEAELEIEATEVADKSEPGITETGPGDPMDYILGSKKPNAPNPEPDPRDTIRPEPIEHELTLYRDQDVKLSVSEESSKVTVESLKDSIRITTEHIPEDEPEQENQEPAVLSLESHNLANKTSAINRNDIQDTPIEQEEQQNPTDAIKITPEPKQPEVTLGFDETGQPIIPKPMFNEVKLSKGVIYYKGKNLILAGGTRVSPADEIKINEKPFDIKPQPGRSKLFYIGICAVGAVLILTALVLSTLTSKDIGQLVGTVSTGVDGRPLIGQGVKIVELNKTVSTNEAGFFVFSDLPTGIYTVEMQAPSGGRTQDRISVIKNQTTTIALRDSRPAENITPVQTPSQIDTRPAATSDAESRPATGKGTLKLSLSPANASAFVDGSPLGVGSNSYKLDPGSYTLTIRKDGYAESSQRIKIDSEKSLAVKVSLQESGQAGFQSKTDNQIAGEQEVAGNYQEAQKYYDRALSKNSRDYSAVLGKARCARAQGSIDKATEYYLQASKMASDKGDANSQLQALGGIIEMRPNTFTAYNSRGDLLLTLGQYDKAADDFARVIELDNRNLGAYYKLGDCFYRAQKYPDALHAFSAAQELNFADPKASAWLTKTYLAMGDKKNAKKAYENFKEIANYSTRLEFRRDPEWKKVLTALGEKE